MTTGVTPIKYEWRPGFVTAIKPEVAARELERIAKRDHEVVPAVLVEESRPVDAPLHDHFDWDTTEAAAKWNQYQAKGMIGALKVVYVRNDTEEPQPPIRAYVSVINRSEPLTGASTPRHYQPVVKVMSAEDLRDQYVRQAFDTLCGWRDRYQDIKDFARIFREIDALKEEFDKAA